MVDTTILTRQQRRARMREQAAERAKVVAGKAQGPQTPHPLMQPKAFAVFAVATFWCAGVDLVDSHAGVALFFCIITVFCTAWLYIDEFKSGRGRKISQWPWAVILIILAEILIPGILWFEKGGETLSGAVNSSFQSGGQTAATITNNGPVINGPVAKPLPNGDARRDCSFSHNEIHAYADGGGPNSIGIAIEGGDFCDNKFDLHASGQGRGVVIDPSGKSIPHTFAAPSGASKAH